MSEFFAGDGSEMVELTPQMKELLDVWMPLNEAQRRHSFMWREHFIKNKILVPWGVALAPGFLLLETS